MPCPYQPPPPGSQSSTALAQATNYPPAPWQLLGAQQAAAATGCYPTYLVYLVPAAQFAALVDVAGRGQPYANLMPTQGQYATSDLYAAGWMVWASAVPPPDNASAPNTPAAPPAQGQPGPTAPGSGTGAAGTITPPPSGTGTILSPPPPPAAPITPPIATVGQGVIQSPGGTVAVTSIQRAAQQGQCCWLTPPPGVGAGPVLSSPGVCMNVAQGVQTLPAGWTAGMAPCTGSPLLPTGARLQSSTTQPGTVAPTAPAGNTYPNLGTTMPAGGAANTTVPAAAGVATPLATPPAATSTLPSAVPQLSVSVNGQALCCAPCSS